MYGIGAYFALAKPRRAFNPGWQAEASAYDAGEVLLALYDCDC